MKKSLFAIVLLIALVGCTDESTARRTLQDQGYSDIQLTGYRPFACGDDYTFHTGFSAKSIAGRPVTGTVCSGLLKGSSIKTD